MSTQHARRFSRRRFLGVTLAGTAGLLGLHARRVAAEPPPETTTLRLVQSPAICAAPQYVAEEFLHGEGFTEVRYVPEVTALGTGQPAVRDLKGKTVAVPGLGSAHHLFLASMVAYVGLDPRKDIEWAAHSPSESIQLLAEGKVDAVVGFPPVPQELRAKGIGHLVVASASDRP